MIKNDQNGYLMLITVITFGVVAVGIAVASSFLAVASSKTSISLQGFHQERAMANGCAEDAIARLRADLAVTNFTNTFTAGSCTVSISGSGNFNRVIDVAATTNEGVWKITVSVAKIVPDTDIVLWQEI